MRGREASLVGQRFGALSVTERFGKTEARGVLWLCACDCGNELIRSTRELRRVASAACTACDSARKSAQFTTHGDTKTLRSPRAPLYRVWQGMLDRCKNPRNRFYANYGGKGVTVYAEWQRYETFRVWALAHGYHHDPAAALGDRLSIDRIDAAGNYEPGNCRWIPCRENSRRAATAAQEVRHLH